MAHSVDLYQIGGGVLYIARWDGSTPPEDTDYTDIGNAPEVSLEYKVETKVHESSRTGTVEEDQEVVIKKEGTLKFTLDELGVDQLAMYFQGVIDSQFSIRPLQADNQYFAVKFTPDVATGEEWEYEIWKVLLSPAGALKLINMKDYNNLQFSGKVLKDVANHPTNPFWRMTKITG